MISEILLKSAINTVIAEAFPKAHIYSQGIVEGFKYPAVFSEMKLVSMNDATINIVEKQYQVTLTYIPKNPTEQDNMEKVTALTEAFKCVDSRNRRRKMCIKVDDDGDERFIKVSDVSYSFVGDRYDLLRVKFALRFYDTEEITDPEPLMEEINQNNEVTEKKVKRHIFSLRK